jgi:alkylated DNA repair dioxygenase AlkB
LFVQDPAPATPTLPEGFRYAENVLSREQETEAVEWIERLDFKPFAFRGFTCNRRTVSFGWRYDFNGGGFQAAAPLPAELLSLRRRAGDFAGIEPTRLEQVSVIEYAPGAGIGWHRDRPQFGQVVGLSLLAPCRFRFRRGEPGHWDRAAAILEPRSAYVLDGPARSEWRHSLPPLGQLRYSVTFRTLSSSGASLVQR